MKYKHGKTLQLKTYLLAFLYFIGTFGVLAQQHKIDSLKFQINSIKINNNKKVDLYNDLAHLYTKSSPDSIKLFTEKSISLAKELNYKNGIADALKVEAVYHYYQGNIDQSYKNLNQSIAIYKEEDNLKGLANAYNNYGLVLNTYGAYKESSEKYKQALAINEKRNDTISIVRNLVNLGNNVSNRSKYKEAKSYYDRAMLLANSTKNYEQQANIYNGYAIVAERTGNFEEAKQNILKAQEIYENLKTPSYLFITYNNIANINRKQSDYAEAIRNFQKALEIANKIENKRYQGIVFNNIASCWYNLESYDKALEMYKASAAIAEPIDQRTYMASISNIALIYERDEDNLQRLQDALNLYKKAEAYFIEQNSNSDLTNTYNNIANVYLKLKDTLASKNYYEEAKKLGEKVSAKYSLTDTYASLAKIYANKKQWNKAIELAEKSIQTAEELKIFNEVIYASNILVEAHEASKNYAEALYYQKKINEVSTELFDKEKNREIGRLEAEMEFKVIEEEIKLANETEILKKEVSINRQKNLIVLFSVILLALIIIIGLLIKLKINEQKAYQSLQKSQEKIENQNRELKKLHDEKNKLFSIIPHDLRGPLKTLKSFFEMSIRNEISEKELKTMVPEIDKNLERIIILTDNLLNWSSKLIKNEQSTKKLVAILDKINEVETLFKTSLDDKKIQFIKVIDANLKVWIIENNLELIFRNLISNAIKYSKINGKITITAKELKSHTEICIEDNGIGMTKKQAQKVFNGELNSIIGTNNEKGSGIGLLLCKTFVEENSGEIWVKHTKPGKGTTVCFTIPK